MIEQEFRRDRKLDLAYAHNQMREGPRYEAHTRTIWIPHFYRAAPIAIEWKLRKFVFDAQRHEWGLVVRAGYTDAEIQASLKKCREHYFALWQRFNSDIVPLEEKA